MTDNQDLIERLEALLAAGSKGPWSYRPLVHDDWGLIRPAPDDPARIAAVSRACQHGDYDDHRVAGTDPFEPNGRLIVEAVNALPTLLSALRSYAKEVEAMREALKPFSAVARWDVGANEDDADLWRPAPKYNVAEPIRVGHLRAARAAVTPADPA